MDRTHKIYKIQFPNEKVYIGQTIDVNSRWREHLREAAIGNNTKVYKAMRKYKIAISCFSIIEDNILTLEESNAKEIFYIAKYDSWHNGYNCNSGGGNTEHLLGENHPFSILTDKELYELRQIRASKIYTLQQVFEFYKDRLSYSGFEKCWNYDSRANIAPEWNTQELADFYKLDKRDCIGESHGNSKLSNDEVVEIRNKYWVEGVKMKDIWESYKELYSLSGFRKVVLGKTYTNIPIPERTSKCQKKKILTKEEVSFIRQKYNEGFKIMEIIRTWFPTVSEPTISTIVHNKRRTNI